jgi:hypothetical protein
VAVSNNHTLSTVTLPHFALIPLFAWADSDTPLCMVEYTHVRLPMLRAFLRCTRASAHATRLPAVHKMCSNCTHGHLPRRSKELLRVPGQMSHSDLAHSIWHSLPASLSLSRPPTSSRVLPRHALSAHVARSNVTTQPILHASS